MIFLNLKRIKLLTMEIIMCWNKVCLFTESSPEPARFSTNVRSMMKIFFCSKASSSENPSRKGATSSGMIPKLKRVNDNSIAGHLT